MARLRALAVLLLCFAWGCESHGHSPGDESSGLSKLLRQVFGGSKAREFFHRWFLSPLPDITLGSAKSTMTADATGLHEQTFITMPIHLVNGQVENKWLPIDWPEGHVAIKSFVADVVKAGADGEVPPATPCCGGPFESSSEESFLHHWTVNKWQLPYQLYQQLVKAGGMDYSLNLQVKGIVELLAGAGLNSGANGPCWDSSLHLFFGIGNEVRSKTKDGNNPYSFPDPYGIEFDGDAMRKKGEFMVLNTHLIDIRNVTNRRGCTECECDVLGVVPRDKRAIGGLTCCHSSHFDGGRCPVEEEAISTNETYYIRYTITWRDFDAATTKPLEVITLDATDNNTKWGDFAIIPGGFQEDHTAMKNDPFTQAAIADPRSGDFDGFQQCHIEYFVPPCAAGESCVHRIVNSWKMPYPVEVVFIRNHFHSGGINMTTIMPHHNCTGMGTYNDKKELTDISTCTVGKDLSQANFRTEAGQTIGVEVIYSQDEKPHYGVMAMSFIYAHVPRESQKSGFLV